MRIISGIALTFSLIMLAFYLFLGTDNMFGTSPSDTIPYISASLSAIIFSWLMEVKYKAHRDIPETSTKKERTIYGTIGISVIILFAVLVAALPLIGG